MAARTERDQGALERELQERISEGEQLRDLARAMADSPDTQSLLQVIIERASVQCRATAATVARITDGTAEIVEASGEAAPYRGVTFPIAASLTETVVRDRVTISREHYDSERMPVVSVPPTATGHVEEDAETPSFVVGPIILTPLLAQGEVLGVLAVMRPAGAPPFDMRNRHCLEMIADYASVALKKSRLIEAAQAANQAKSTFLATMSHELRTPLTALTGYGELLADEIVGPLTPLQRDTIERMRAVTHHLTVMIDEILTFSSIEAGRERVVRATVSPAEVLRAAAAVIEPLAHKKHVALILEADDGVPPLHSDADKLRQILVNLAGNAIKFTDAGFVRLSVNGGSREVCFMVADSGIGIAADDLGRLFQPFTQVDASLTRRHGGTGLGLYISGRLASLLDGRIDVRSTLGVGSTFTLHVPR